MSDNTMTADSDSACLVLASRSPRRSELLRQIGARFRVLSADIDESVFAGEIPEDYVVRVATNKAQSVASGLDTGVCVLGAETSVVLAGHILGKPDDREHAREMLSQLSDRTHQVLSAVSLIFPDGSCHCRLSTSHVTFALLHSSWIDAYCATTEPLDKAGAYAIQGVAAQMIPRLEGSFSGVMGLPLFETTELLRKAGIPLSPVLATQSDMILRSD